MRLTTTLAVATLSASALSLLTTPASAATTVTRTASCTNASGSYSVTFQVDDDATRYGTLRAAQGSSPGIELTGDPVLTVRVRNGAGQVVTSRTARDGSMSLTFARVIGGPRWTAEATLHNTAAGPCTTPRVTLATT